MPQTFFNAAVALMVISIAARVMAKQATTGKIIDISSDIISYHDKVLQLKVHWNDTLPKETKYNVIVRNLTKIHEMPCSLFDIPKPSKPIIIPENPMAHVEGSMECSYIPGYNYSLTVETSSTIPKASISRTIPLSIPYCLGQICSCKHAHDLPPINATIDFITNRTIDINWHIESHNLTLQENQLTSNDLGLSSIYMKLSEATQPSLSWGGKHIHIAENVYPIEERHHVNDTKGLLRGSVRVELGEPLSVKAVLFLRSYVIDALRCDGPEKTIKAQVPLRLVPSAALLENDHHMRIGLIVVSILFVLAIAVSLSFIMWRRHLAKLDMNNIKEDMLFPMRTFNRRIPGVIDRMDDNINYVDKYIADAQAQGLADMFEVPHYALQMGPEIGEGAFGRVYKAYAQNIRGIPGTIIVAVKQLIKNPSADEVGEFLTEIEMLKGVGEHRNIVTFLGCCTIRAPYLMIMEYVGRGDLLSYLRVVRELVKTDGNGADDAEGVKYIELQMSKDSSCDYVEQTRQTKPSETETTYTMIDGEMPICEACNCEAFQYILDNKELHFFAVQIANGMRFLEERQITHRDLAARNVLIDEHKTLKISDFGLSRHGIYTNTKTRKLPLRWLSIEAIRDNLYSNKSDVWAYGVVLWEIGTLGASPYPTISNHELIPFLLSGQRLEKPEICTDEVYGIMQQCWLEDPNARPDFEYLYRTLTKKTLYVNINSLSDDYVFPPIQSENIR